MNPVGETQGWKRFRMGTQMFGFAGKGWMWRECPAQVQVSPKGRLPASRLALCDLLITASFTTAFQHPASPCWSGSHHIFQCVGPIVPWLGKQKLGQFQGSAFHLKYPVLWSFLFFFFLPLCVSNLNPFPWSETSNTPLWLYREVVPPADWV